MLVIFIVFQSIGGRYQDVSFIFLFVVVLLPALSAALWSQYGRENFVTGQRSISTATNSGRLAFVIDHEHDDPTAHSVV